MKYVYPAVFTAEPTGQYSILFPDLPNCITQGENLQDGIEMAEDALCLTLYHMEQEGIEIPQATVVFDIQTEENQFVTLISCDTFDYEKFYKNRSVKKTLTIPEWLNDMAIRENVNFSNVLQNALMERFHISR